MFSCASIWEVNEASGLDVRLDAAGEELREGDGGVGGN